MAIDNNEKDIRKSTEQGGAAPKKKLNIVFRKQNSSSIKELPKGLRNAAGENGTAKRRPASAKTAKSAESESSVRRPRPLPAGTKPVKPVLKELEESQQAENTALKAEETKNKAEELQAVKQEEAKHETVLKQEAAPAEVKAAPAEAKQPEVKAEKSAEAEEKTAAKAETEKSVKTEEPKEAKTEEKKSDIFGATDIIPKVRIVKSYANYNAAEVIAEASRQARQAAAATGSRDGRKRPEGGRGGRPQGQGRPAGNGERRGQGRAAGNGDGNGRTFIVRGNASEGGRGGRPQGQGRPAGGGRPGAGGMSAPAFDGASGKNGGRNQRGGAGRNDRRDRKDKFVDTPSLKTPKTGKGAFIKPEPKKEKPEDEVKLIVIPEKLTIKDLADKLKMQPSVIVKKLFLEGKMVTPNTELSYEEAEEIAIEYDILCEKEVQEDVIAELLKEDEEDEADLVTRNPVVCVMGHVDHGKTSLLDAIRNTNVTSREAGGITQHIGASVVKVGDRCITFLDTPGHEAFTSMRLRGAQSTDIAVLVVAADDGVKPQTIEAISHAKAAGVEVVVAINKMDKPAANVDLVKSQLTEYGLIAEDYGGSTPMVPVSAKSGEGIPELLDMILLEADVLELKANPNRNARGLVIEAQLDKGRGPVATVLVQKGTLKVGDNVVAGSCYGKVRAMLDDKGNRIKKAAPSYPAEILGLNDVPNAGEVFMVCADEKEARSIAETFISEQKKHMLEETKQKMNLDDLFDEIKAGNVKELPIIVKADVQGSVEAVKQSLGKLSNEEVAVKVIHAAAGNINESDVTLASTANAIIIGFNVKPDATAKATAEREKVDMRLYKVIYQAIEDLQAALTGMLAPVYEEKYTGRAVVRQVFKASNVGNIAGCYVTDGVIERGSKARVFRGDKQLFDGDIASLKRFKDEVKEVKLGFECGIVLEDFSDIQVDDTLEVYKMVQVQRGAAAE